MTSNLRGSDSRKSHLALELLYSDLTKPAGLVTVLLPPLSQSRATYSLGQKQGCSMPVQRALVTSTSSTSLYIDCRWKARVSFGPDKLRRRCIAAAYVHPDLCCSCCCHTVLDCQCWHRTWLRGLGNPQYPAICPLVHHTAAQCTFPALHRGCALLGVPGSPVSGEARPFQ